VWVAEPRINSKSRFQMPPCGELSTTVHMGHAAGTVRTVLAGCGWLPETPRKPEAAFPGFGRKWVQDIQSTGWLQLSEKVFALISTSG
jgi:hypothetical protein